MNKNFNFKYFLFIFLKKSDMKILLTNHSLSTLGGSETFTYTMAKELASREDIELEVYSPKLGIISDKLTQEGIKTTKQFSQNEYDLILASQVSTVRRLGNIKGLKVQTCHGVHVSEEKPEKGVDKYVAISQEVHDSLKKVNIESTIINNGVDCERFKPVNPLNPEVKQILSLSQSAELNKMIENVCNKMGIKLVALNKFKNPIFDVENIINDSDLVISLGRGVYESMACGRNVLILDKRPYIPGKPIGDGMIIKDNVTEFLQNNCSGRFSRREFDEMAIIQEIKNYNPLQGEANRQYALEHLNIKTKVDDYLKLYEV